MPSKSEYSHARSAVHTSPVHTLDPGQPELCWECHDMPSKPEYSHACCAALTLCVQFMYSTDHVCAVHYSTDPVCAVHVQHRPCVCSSRTAQTLHVQFMYTNVNVNILNGCVSLRLNSNSWGQNWNHTSVSYVSLSLQATGGLWL